MCRTQVLSLREDLLRSKNSTPSRPESEWGRSPISANLRGFLPVSS
jgi:hypothetical protein